MIGNWIIECPYTGDPVCVDYATFRNLATFEDWCYNWNVWLCPEWWRHRVQWKATMRADVLHSDWWRGACPTRKQPGPIPEPGWPEEEEPELPC